MKLEGHNGAPVNSDDFGNLKTRAIVRSEMNDAADQEKAYSWVSAYTTAGAENIIYIKNTHETDILEIHNVILGTAANAVFTLHEVTGTAGGTTITGSPLNLQSTRTASVSSYGDASVTGLTLGNALMKFRVLANYGDEFDVAGGVIVPPGKAIAVANTATGACDCTIFGHFNSLEKA